MIRLLLLSIIMVLPIGAHPTTIMPTEFAPSPDELKTLGVKFEFYTGPSCGGAAEVTVQLPATFRGSSFTGGSLEILDREKTVLFVNVGVGYDEMASEESGVNKMFFCLDPSLYSSSLLRLYYSRGQHTTDMIIINIDEAHQP